LISRRRFLQGLVGVMALVRRPVAVATKRLRRRYPSIYYNDYRSNFNRRVRYDGTS
jgi:hypothetical protein